MKKSPEPSISYRWRILATAAFCFLIYAVVVFNIPPVLGILIDLFNISHTEAGLLMSLAIFPSILLSFPFGLLADRYGARITGSLALVVMILGTAVVALGSSYWILIIGRIILGIAATMLVVAMPKLITTWFAGHEMGLAMGIYHTAFPIGNVLVLNFVGVLAYNMGWQTPIWVCAALSAVALVVYIVLARDRNRDQFQTSASSNIFRSIRLAGWKMWCLGITWGLFGAGTIAFFTYGPDYFVSIGKDVSQAGLISSAPMFGSILLAPVVGMLIDRLGRKWLFVVAGLLGITLILFFIPYVANHELIMAIVMGIFIAMVTPAVFSLPGEMLPPDAQGIGFGIVLTCQGLGNVLGPIVAGFFRDVTGNYFWSFVAMSAMIVMAIIPMVILQVFRKKPA